MFKSLSLSLILCGEGEWIRRVLIFREKICISFIWRSQLTYLSFLCLFIVSRYPLPPDKLKKNKKTLYFEIRAFDIFRIFSWTDVPFSMDRSSSSLYIHIYKWNSGCNWNGFFGYAPIPEICKFFSPWMRIRCTQINTDPKWLTLQKREKINK